MAELLIPVVGQPPLLTETQLAAEPFESRLVDVTSKINHEQEMQHDGWFL